MAGKKLKKITTARKKGASKKTFNQADEMENVNEERVLLQRIQEAMAELEKLKQENRKQELDLLLFSALQNEKVIANFTTGDLIDLFNVIQKKEIDIKMAKLE